MSAVRVPCIALVKTAQGCLAITFCAEDKKAEMKWGCRITVLSTEPGLQQREGIVCIEVFELKQTLSAEDVCCCSHELADEGARPVVSSIHFGTWQLVQHEGRGRCQKRKSLRFALGPSLVHPRASFDPVSILQARHERDNIKKRYSHLTKEPNLG